MNIIKETIFNQEKFATDSSIQRSTRNTYLNDYFWSITEKSTLSAMLRGCVAHPRLARSLQATASSWICR